MPYAQLSRVVSVSVCHNRWHHKWMEAVACLQFWIPLIIRRILGLDAKAGPEGHARSVPKC